MQYGKKALLKILWIFLDKKVLYGHHKIIFNFYVKDFRLQSNDSAFLLCSIAADIYVIFIITDYNFHF